jgi:hypothetical protein
MGRDLGGMSFNVSKCKVMHVGQRNTYTGHKCTMSGRKLAATNEERDIGVTVCGSLRPVQQGSRNSDSCTWPNL